MARAFLRLDLDLVDAEGYAVAAVYDTIRWHADQGPWAATHEQIADAARLGMKAVKAATKRLRELGLVTSRNSDYGTRTQAWTLPDTKVPLGTYNGPVGTFAPYTDHRPTTTTSVADAPTTAKTPGRTPPAMPDETLPGLLVPLPTNHTPEPVVTAPPKNGGTLVARWVDGYRTRGKGDPPVAVLKRVAGQCGSLARVCDGAGDPSREWPIAWHAAYEAGTREVIDPVKCMLEPQSQFRPQPKPASPHVQALKDQGTPLTEGQRDVFRAVGMLPTDQPRAIGGAS